MNRGECYLVKKPSARDPRKQRAFVVVSRNMAIQSSFSSVICAPIYSQHEGLSTQVLVGQEEGLKKESSVHCDELYSLDKAVLTNYLGSIRGPKLAELNRALAIAVGLHDF